MPEDKKPEVPVEKAPNKVIDFCKRNPKKLIALALFAASLFIPEEYKFLVDLLSQVSGVATPTQGQ